MDQSTRGRWARKLDLRALIAIVLAVSAKVAFFIHLRFHWDLIGLMRAGVDTSALSWCLMDSLKLVSVAAALVALVLSILALRKRPGWLAAVALLLSAIACLTIPVIT